MIFLFVNRVRPEVSPEALAAVIPAHARWIDEQLAAGTVAQAGKWGEIGGAVFYRADSLEQAEALAAEDPLVSSGLITNEIARFWPLREL